MNFNVNGTPYFLTFDAENEQWCVLTPGRQGVESLAVLDDGVVVPPPRHAMLMPSTVN